jgi:hypothetical protein
VCGEYGGIGYFEQGHIWQEGNPYETVNSHAQLLEKYKQYADMVIQMKSSSGLNAAVYTEITDVQMELNGLVTFDRKVVKGNASDFYAVNQQVINETRSYTTLVPTSEKTPQAWKYTTAQPAADWMSVKFNDSAWTSGNGGFGSEGTPGAIIGTEWKANDIWLRRTFTLPAGSLGTGKTLLLRIHHDEDCEVYINGVQAIALPGHTGGYISYEMSAAAKAALKAGGKNTLAVHCRQTTGGQYIDAGISSMQKK